MKIFGGYTPKWGSMSEKSYLFSFGTKTDVKPQKFPYNSNGFDQRLTFGKDLVLSFSANYAQSNGLHRRPTVTVTGSRCTASINIGDTYEAEESLVQNVDVSLIEVWVCS